jgi:hypothetical protein
MPRTNAECRAYVAQMLEVPREDIVGWVLVAATADLHIRILSNGNKAQIRGLLSQALDKPEMVEDEFTNGAEVTDA